LKNRHPFNNSQSAIFFTSFLSIRCLNIIRFYRSSAIIVPINVKITNIIISKDFL
jgi:hypothetical protein